MRSSANTEGTSRERTRKHVTEASILATFNLIQESFGHTL